MSDTCIYIYIYMEREMLIDAYVCIYIYIYIYMQVCICIYIYIYIHMYLFMCLFIYDSGISAPHFGMLRFGPMRTDHAHDAPSFFRNAASFSTDMVGIKLLD